MRTRKRLTVGSFLIVFTLGVLSPTAHANEITVWSSSWCGPDSAWTGLAGLNNDNPGPATITGLTVSNGVSLSGLALGQTMGSFEKGNLEGTAAGLPLSTASFTVTVTVAVSGGPTLTRSITVNAPAGCAPTANQVTPTTTLGSTTTAVSTTTTAVPLPTSVVNTPTVPPAETPLPTTLGPTSVPLTPTVLGVTITTAPSVTATLPRTGGDSDDQTAIGIILVVIGVCFVSLSRLQRAPD